MKEQDTSRYEHKEVNQEALEQARIERQAELEKHFEQVEKKSPENSQELHREAIEKATSIEQTKTAHETTDKDTHEKERPRTRRHAQELDASYNAKMNEVRTHMSAPSRAFSKVIHNKTVESVSGAVGSTVARPNAILSGAVFAFVLTLGVYVLAKNLGYPLSGFETIGAFILGWILGIAYDFLKVMITGRK